MRRFVSTAGILGLLLIVLGVAGTAHEATAAKPSPPRFVDNLDGTITDTQTGLMWEKKTGSVGGGANPADPTNVDNPYTWSCTGGSCTGIAPDGTLFTDFLARMNCTILSLGGACGPGLYTDWRIPTIVELQTILAPCPGGAAPCIDPIFGPTAASLYWSSSSLDGTTAFAWLVRFLDGDVFVGFKSSGLFVRAVRGGP
jgi:hypothetical protein